MDIDVTDLLHDPFIAGEEFIVIRRRETINAYGERTSHPIQRLLAVGSIQPTGNNSLVREEAYQTETKTIKVITDFLLRGPTKDKSQPQGATVTFDPDIVIWRGDSYVVKSIDDYSQYGIGMVQAECASVDYVDQAPLDQVS